MDILVRKPTKKEIAEASSWGEWSKAPSEFLWSYDNTESCLILEGKATVVSDNGKKASFGPGDFVVFPEGLKCRWKIEQKIKKKYTFG